MITSSAVMSLGDVIFRNAQLFGDKPAFVSASAEATSFESLKSRVCKLAEFCQRSGLQRGSRIGILARNRPEFFEVVGLSSAGYIPVPINWRLSVDEIVEIISDCRPELLIADLDFTFGETTFIDRLGPSVMLVCFDGEVQGWQSYERLIAGSTEATFAIAAADDVACIIYTSGTTGRPKGAELTHGALIRNGIRAAELLSLESTDIALAAMPLFHVGGLWYHFVPSFIRGCTTIVLPSFEPIAVLAAIERYRVTNVHLVPTMLHGLLETPVLASSDVSSLRVIFYAASSIPSALLKRAMSAFGDCGFVQGYGSTEGGMIACLSPSDHKAAMEPGHEHLLQSCGRVLADVSVTLSEVHDDVGEICVTSLMTMKRYWGLKDHHAMVLTGDLGRFDSKGYLYILDRRSDMIVTGGENVYPREVEDVLMTDSRLAEAVVFDLPHDKWVQAVVAAVVPKPGQDVDSLSVIEKARQSLASFKCPKQVFIVTSLPKNGAGKVLRKELRRSFAAKSQQEVNFG